MSLADGMFELDGVQWGDRGLLIATEFDPGSVDLRTQDEALPGVHGVQPGRDMLGGSTWAWTVSTNTTDLDGALSAARGLAAVWRGYLAEPTRLARLRHTLGDRTVCVFGRPRRFSGPSGSVLARQGAGPVVIDFALTDPVVYADALESLELSLVQDTDGGAVWPVTWPVVWGASSVARQGLVFVDGDARVPFRVVVVGPVTGQCSDITVTGPGWAVDVPGPVAFDEQLVVDTRSMTATIGGRHGVELSRRTRLNARLAPGQSELTFSCADATRTATATVSWRPGWHSL